MLSRLNHSLSAKLLLLFICAGAVLLLLVGSIIGKGLSRYVRYNVQPLMAQSASVMESTLGVPPSAAKATELSRIGDIDIAFSGAASQWSTANDMAEMISWSPNRETWRRIDNGNPEYWAMPLDTGWLLRASRQDYQLFFRFP